MCRAAPTELGSKDPAGRHSRSGKMPPWVETAAGEIDQAAAWPRWASAVGLLKTGITVTLKLALLAFRPHPKL